MSSEKLARLIVDFDQPEPPKARSRVVPFDYLHHSSGPSQHQPLFQPAKQQPSMQPPPQARQKPVSMPEDDAYERGRSEGYAAAVEMLQGKLDQEKQEVAAQAAQERQRLTEEVAEKLAGDIAAMGNQLQERIAGVTARLLEPLISNAVQKQAVATFVEQLSTITTDSRRPMLRITGPSDLLDQIRSKLGTRAIGWELRPGNEVEVSTVVDQIVLETQLKIWSDRLKLAIRT